MPRRARAPRRPGMSRGGLLEHRARSRRRRRARSKPRRSRLEPDEHVALPRRLEHGRDLQARRRRSPPSPGSGLDDLVADERSSRAAAAQADELALARLERERRRPAACGERRAPRAGGDDDRAARQHALARAQAPSPVPADRDAVHLDAGLRRAARAGQRARDRARRALQVAGRTGRAGAARPVSSGSSARASRASTQLALHAGGAQALDPRRLGRPRRLAAVDDQRALAADARLGAEARLELVVDGAARRA